MPRGGARPGAGRPRKDTVRQALPRVSVVVSAVDAAAVPSAGMLPLEYLLSIVRDEQADEKLRLQAAAIAAPFLHAKPTVGGKKDERATAAKVAATGKFAAAEPPLKLVSR